jgi:ribosomal biogenesis protein LAS1
MVQYIFTPWRDRRELLAVRSQFYPEKNLHHQPNSGPLLRDGSGMLASPEQPGNEDEYEAEAAAKEREEQEQQQQQQQQQAVARVSMWMHRGACPHLVESTALLTAALLSDDGLFLGLGRRRRGWGRGGGNWISSSAADEEALQGQQQQQQQERIAEGESGSAQASRGYAVRAAYSAAFSRCVCYHPTLLPISVGFIYVPTS